MRKLSALLLCLTMAIGVVLLTGCPRPEEPVNDVEPAPEVWEDPVAEPEPMPPMDEEEPYDDELPPPEEEVPPPVDGEEGEGDVAY
jgi:hypothetical protein